MLIYFMFFQSESGLSQVPGNCNHVQNGRYFLLLQEVESEDAPSAVVTGPGVLRQSLKRFLVFRAYRKTFKALSVSEIVAADCQIRKNCILNPKERHKESENPACVINEWCSYSLSSIISFCFFFSPNLNNPRILILGDCF